MSAHPANPSDFPRLALSTEREGDPAPTLTPTPTHAPDSDSVTSSPVPLSTSSPSPFPPPFSEYLDTEFDNPARERLRRQAERRANPTDARLAKEHERIRGYKDKGTPPPRLAIPHFNPSPEATTRILDAICDRTRSLTDIAAEHHTTFQVLTFFLSRPDIKERLDALTAAAVSRAHFFIADNLPAIAYFLMETLRSAHNDHDRSGYLPQTSKGFSLLLRSREDIRKTVSLLLRIGNYSTGPRQPRQPRDPSNTTAPRSSTHQQTTDALSEVSSSGWDTKGVGEGGGEGSANNHSHSITPPSREYEDRIHNSSSSPSGASAFEPNGLTDSSPGSQRLAAHPGYNRAESSHAESVQQTGAQPAANATDNTDATDTHDDESPDESPDEPARDPYRVAQIIGFVHEADPTALAGLSRAQFLALTKDANRIVCQQYGGDPRLLSREDFFTRFAQAIRLLRDARGIGKDPATDPP